jgi:Holliday junction resolvase
MSSFARFLILASFLAGTNLSAQDPPEGNGETETVRDTTTGEDFENLIKSRLEHQGFQMAEQIRVGTRPNGGKHKIDLVATKDDKSYLISLKWQQSSGTAEQKVPYEIICLSEALKQSRGKHTAAYLVLGGDGWTLKKFYLSGGLDRHLNLDQPVRLMSAKAFLRRASKGL